MPDDPTKDDPEITEVDLPDDVDDDDEGVPSPKSDPVPEDE